MGKLKLESPTINRKEEAIEYINEFIEYKSNINGTGSLDDNVDNYENWLKNLEKNSKNEIVGKVPSSTYFAIRESDNKIIGMINIRHELNEYLAKYGGHIGYGIRPTERKKGYASQLLLLGVEICFNKGIRNILLTVDSNNLGSIKVIENNMGVFENSLIEGEEITNRYWIDAEILLTKTIKKFNI